MATATHNVVRYTALISGIFYGIVHQGTLQQKYDDAKEKHHADHRAQLVQKARDAYAAKLLADKSGSSKLITDPDDPQFDFDKVVESWEKSVS